MVTTMTPEFQLTLHANHCRITFPAMASLCEVLLDTTDTQLALTLGELARDEAQRIEQKFSRYRDDNAVWAINHSHGKPVTVDEETAAMMGFAETLWHLSEGRFDVTSGVLRRAWRFDGSDNVPDERDIRALLPLIGWQQVIWQSPQVTLPEGMEIDFGGIGKEYAVDKVFEQLRQRWNGALLVNFGGDLRAHGPRGDGQPWQVGVEQVIADQPTKVISLTEGGLATSGDARRFLLKDGVRYSHILDPRSGWPVADAPRSVTTIAPTCLQAGMLSSLAMLMGSDAEAYLDHQKVRYWSLR